MSDMRAAGPEWDAPGRLFICIYDVNKKEEIFFK